MVTGKTDGSHGKNKPMGLLFWFCQVNNSKLLKEDYFFTWHIVLGVGKSQDLPSRN
jgi:hypothetical protein